MGGTRCVFRDCQVSTQRNPKMHFFKLPVRDPVRLEAWLKNCGNTDILNVAREKLSNRAVCARHFRYECFMNYKLDRLIPNQTPTLARISKELAWDLGHLDENGEATMVKLTTPTLVHLIPPENFECPLGFSEDGRFGRKYAVRSRTPPRPLAIDEIKRQKITPVQEQQPISRIEMSQVIDLCAEDNVTTPKLAKLETEDSKPAFAALQQDRNLAELQKKYDELQASFDLITAQNASLKATVAKLETQPKQNPPLSAATPTQLSKPQLYNGIKKYLGPSMAALVRMEMFGDGERAWKEDEREFAKELLQLGEHVYTHCCDEWRFRLPSLRTTRSWLEDQAKHEADNEETEDL
ncbi:uncharacterized protein LOC133839839 [Drosophila sulfurigaster albostrigata]|uniref:uncharacterized protein LOC133839839 n=1 Tax=Drosophila sulfurigaster albostrigata TaxID=89887 RepID=UPI002D21B23E|nr:uncharacterized protein LOC133839839 [Drosophila sulfurigaster albostrigata]